MAEYMFEDLIINPETKGLESLIGKEVYFSNVPLYCLKDAKYNRKTGMLIDICKNDDYPFRVKTSKGEIIEFACIIPKKEGPNPEYVPFESVDEFLDVYKYSTYSIKRDSVENKLINRGGIWIKREYGDCCNYYNVTELCDESGIVIGGSTFSTIWKVLLMNYKFLDGTPCGKLKGEEL